MYIKEIIMDGFKCYKNKTIISDIDYSFTAITGQNGSGKSNIIDAILFCLDLLNAKSMRAGKLKELININRKDCCVTLKMMKSDKSMIEVSRYLKITRNNENDGQLSKFKINNSTVTKASIENLCKSLNISRNFVVLQGQITKLIDIKPSSLRYLVEETAGIRNYNVEKEKSNVLLLQKETKLVQAKNFLSQRVNPYIAKLNEEKHKYEKNKEIEENISAYREIYNKLIENYELLTHRRIRYEIAENIKELFDVEEELLEVNNKLSEISSSKLTKMDKLNKKRTLEDLEVSMKSIEREKIIKEEKHNNIIVQREQYNLNELQETERMISQQLSSTNYVDKFTALNQYKQQLMRLKEQLQSFEDFKRKLEKFYQITNFKCKITSASFIAREISVQKISDLYENAKSRSEDFIEKKREFEELRNKFIYPVENDKISGTVSELFSINDPRYDVAISTILGNRKNFIVVENDDTASELIKLSDRKISCIPLNRITSNYSKRNNVRLMNLLETITYGTKYQKVMEYLFGQYYVSENNNDAKETCFKQKVYCITLDGTVYDPRGTLTGGKNNFRNITKDFVPSKERYRELKKAIHCFSNDFQHTSKEELEKLYMNITNYLLKNSEARTLEEKIHLLEDICHDKKDPKKELCEIREAIIKAQREDNVIKKNIEEKQELRAKISEGKQKLLDISEKRDVLVNELRKMDQLELEMTDQNFINSTESKKKELTKRIIVLENIIRKEISSGIERISKLKIFHIERHLLSSKNLYKKFGIELEEGEEEFVDEQEMLRMKRKKEDLELKLSAKKERLTMEPSNFELLSKNEKTVEDLNEKMEKLQIDKEKILKNATTISEIGKKEYQKAFYHINKCLSKFLKFFYHDSDIYIDDSYEIKVKISSDNFVNLQSLSGGQRSLIALCLIFSMLKYKPAPFYLFDEIDAALDINYTEMIGEIIHEEFNGAQFIVVSLKNNMFDNANRIFRVFQDQGISKIEKTK